MKTYLFSFFILCNFLYAQDQLWDFQHRYKLKKDEIAQVVIATAESKGEDKRTLFFRWTLIVKDRVSTLVNYRGYPHQYILYNKRSLDRISLPLLSIDDALGERTYLMLVLSDINQGKDEVVFDIFIKDNKKRILVDFDPTKDK